MEFKDWNLPKGLNVDFLLRFISEKKLLKVMEEMADRPRKERRIILPSRSCLRKCLIYYLVETFKGDFDVVMNILRGKEKILAKKRLYKGNIRRLYESRKRELEREIKNEK